MLPIWVTDIYTGKSYKGWIRCLSYSGLFILVIFCNTVSWGIKHFLCIEAVADYTEQSLQEVRQSEFEVSQNTFTQLSFTTYNYLYSLVNDRFTGSSDFLYTGKDIDGNLIFKTSLYTEPAR